MRPSTVKGLLVGIPNPGGPAVGGPEWPAEPPQRPLERLLTAPQRPLERLLTTPVSTQKPGQDENEPV